MNLYLEVNVACILICRPIDGMLCGASNELCVPRNELCGAGSELCANDACSIYLVYLDVRARMRMGRGRGGTCT